MKKLFALCSTFILASFCFSGGLKHEPQFVYAEEETSQVETSESSEETSETTDLTSEEEQTSENTESEKKTLSQSAKDVIEVVKSIFNQPIVIGGITISLGTLLLWVIGKLIVKALDNKETKYEKKLKDLLEKLGVSEEQIAKLFSDFELLDKIVKELVNNTKNVKVKEKLLALYEENKDKLEDAKEIIEETKESTETLVDDTQNKIKELLEK